MAAQAARPALESAFRQFRPLLAKAGPLLLTIVSGSLAERRRRRALLWALGVSLALHVVGMLLIERSVGALGAAAPGPGVRLSARLAAPTALLPAAHAADSADAAELRALPAAASARQAARAGEALSDDGLAVPGQPRPAAPLPAVASLPPPRAVDERPAAEYLRPPVPSVAALLLDEPLIELPARRSDEAPAAGRVELRIFVGPGGAVEGVDVLDSSLPPAYGEAAVAAFSSLRFRPAEVAGTAVRSELRFEVVFDDRDEGSSHASDRASGRDFARRQGATEQGALPATR